MFLKVIRKGNKGLQSWRCKQESKLQKPVIMVSGQLARGRKAALEKTEKKVKGIYFFFACVDLLESYSVCGKYVG